MKANDKLNVCCCCQCAADVQSIGRIYRCRSPTAPYKAESKAPAPPTPTSETPYIFSATQFVFFLLFIAANSKQAKFVQVESDFLVLIFNSVYKWLLEIKKFLSLGL